MALRCCVLVFALVGACGGAHLEKSAKHGAPKSAAASSASVSPSASVSLPIEKPYRVVHAAVGCFVGGAWVEALGALGEERTLATVHRCRILSTEVLGAKPDDETALEAARSIAPAVVDAVVARVAPDPDRVALVRAVASAAREAAEARRNADSLRKDANAKPADTLAAKQGLAQLMGLKLAKHSALAHVAALVLAADHVESSRGLSARAKILAASPTFEVVFSVPRPTDPEAWIPYVSAAAKAGGHPPSDSTEETAFAGVVTAFADKFEALANAPGEAGEVASGYAKRLRKQLSDAAKKAAKK